MAQSITKYNTKLAYDNIFIVVPLRNRYGTVKINAKIEKESVRAGRRPKSTCHTYWIYADKAKDIPYKEISVPTDPNCIL